MLNEIHDQEIVSPPSLPQASSLTLGTALAGPRRRIYEVTDPTNQYLLPPVLSNYNIWPREFACGHTCRYISPATRHICREIEPYAVCLWCLTGAIDNLVPGDYYPEFVSDEFFGTDRKGQAAAARYYVSLLECYYELNSRAGTRLCYELDADQRNTLNFLLWNQLTGFASDHWLSEDGNLSILQGALQVIRHITRGKGFYEADDIGLANRIGLAIDAHY